MVEVSIRDLEEICFQAGKLAEKEAREKIKIVNLTNILGSHELSEDERLSYQEDVKLVQEKMAEFKKEFEELTKKRIDLNNKINDAVKAAMNG